jgi:integrase/recombinase XerD
LIISKLIRDYDQRRLFRIYDNSGLPHDDLNEYLRHLEFRDLAPNTVRAYAFDLIHFFTYLNSLTKCWSDINIDTLHRYIHSLRYAQSEKVSLIPNSESFLRSERTISRMFSSVLSFYRYQYLQHGILAKLGDSGIFEPNKSSKHYISFFSFAKAVRPKSVKRSSLTLRPWKDKQALLPKVLDSASQRNFVDACANQRDRLLILLMLETGMRVGQAIQLKHEDIESWNMSLTVRHRLDNPNEAYSKSRHEYKVHLSKEWLDLYTDFIIYEQDDVESDYVFTALYRKDNGSPSSPISYHRVNKIFRDLSKNTGIKVTPHMLRHTHATELLRDKVPIEIVAKRLGHKSIETTKQLYEHLSAQDMREIIDSHKARDDD